MNGKIIGNLIADAAITGSTALIALLSQEGVNKLNDISQAAYVVVALGIIAAASKGYKTLQANPA